MFIGEMVLISLPLDKQRLWGYIGLPFLLVFVRKKNLQIMLSMKLEIANDLTVCHDFEPRSCQKVMVSFLLFFLERERERKRERRERERALQIITKNMMWTSLSKRNMKQHCTTEASATFMKFQDFEQVIYVSYSPLCSVSPLNPFS